MYFRAPCRGHVALDHQFSIVAQQKNNVAEVDRSKLTKIRSGASFAAFGG
jgi:hypothetical protein